MNNVSDAHYLSLSQIKNTLDNQGVDKGQELRAKGNVLYSKDTDKPSTFSNAKSRTSHQHQAKELVMKSLMVEHRIPESKAQELLSSVLGDSPAITKGHIDNLKSQVQEQRQDWAQHAGLLNKAVTPEVAAAFQDKVSFDGIGRVGGFNADIPEEDIARLTAGVTESLTQTNSSHARLAPKIPIDSLMLFSHKLKQMNSEPARQFYNQAQSLWLSGKINNGNLKELYASVVANPQTTPEIKSLAEELLAHTATESHGTQLADNLFGRKFDSEVAHAMIKNPSESAIQTARQTGEYLLSDFTQIAENKTDEKRQQMLSSLANAITGDSRPWFNKTPSLQAFLEHQSMESLEGMLTEVKSGFDAIKMPFLAVKMATVAEQKILNISGWKEEGDKFYENIRDTRSTANVFKHKTAEGKDVTINIDQRKTDDYGTRLFYQPHNNQYTDFGEGRSVADGRQLDFDKMTAFEKNAFANGQSVVSGTSGSTNIMWHLNEHIASKNEHFSADQAFLNTMMFLVFDGGHSINESLSVYNALESNTEPMPKAPTLPENPSQEDANQYLADKSEFNTLLNAINDKRKSVLQTQTVGYSDLLSIVPGEQEHMTNVLTEAFEATLEHFAQHAHSARTSNFA